MIQQNIKRSLFQFYAILTLSFDFILSSADTNFLRDAAYDERNCKYGDAAFTTNAKSRIGCGTLCQSEAGCHSWFYNSMDRMCYGCTCAYTISNPLPRKPGTEYYATAHVAIVKPVIEITPATYAHYLDIEWTITSPCDMVITIQFKNLNMETSDKCKYDSVQVYDGPTRASELLGMFCPVNATLLAYTSSTNQMSVQFVTDGSITGTGFSSTINFVYNN